MKSTLMWALVALNCALVGALAERYVRPNTAHAAGGRRPNYVIIPGEVPGGGNAVVYILDTANRQLSARALNNQGQNWRLDDMPPINLERIFEEQEAEGDRGKAGDRRARD